MFTVRPRPLPEESLWSLLIRISKQNGVPLLRILNAIKTWETRYVQRSDVGLLDLTPGSLVNMEELASLVGYSAHELLATTFHFLIRTFAVSEDVQRARLLSGMILDRYRFCPLCLKETLYYRLRWKIDLVTACVHHEVLLVDRCPQCRTQIKFRDIVNIGCKIPNSSG
ncbi:MAG: TniQ family protein [Alicyclobacillus sp.]|nr:TniQ family protein [Alicyclobacillus sp.]